MKWPSLPHLQIEIWKATIENGIQLDKRKNYIRISLRMLVNTIIYISHESIISLKETSLKRAFRKMMRAVGRMDLEI